MTAGKELLACWSNIVNLYEEDKKKTICLTKLTFSSVHPKPLKPQIVMLAYQVFNEKTMAAFKILQYIFLKTF